MEIEINNNNNSRIRTNSSGGNGDEWNNRNNETKWDNMHWKMYWTITKLKKSTTAVKSRIKWAIKKCYYCGSRINLTFILWTMKNEHGQYLLNAMRNHRQMYHTVERHRYGPMNWAVTTQHSLTHNSISILMTKRQSDDEANNLYLDVVDR